MTALCNRVWIMAATQGEARLSSKQLLEAAERMPQSEFDSFLKKMLLLRARRTASCLPRKEARLLQKINRGLSEKDRRRFYELIDKRRAEALTRTEYAELLKLTRQVDKRNVERLESLIELARLRGLTVDQLMNQLGIKPPPIYG